MKLTAALFPYRTLSVSQIPGTFGQGWPGLLYLSTYSFLTPQAQQRAGLSSTGQQAFTDIVPYHEAAHQWWGNVIGWSSYRDQWIDEAIANYLALALRRQQKAVGARASRLARALPQTAHRKSLPARTHLRTRLERWLSATG